MNDETKPQSQLIEELVCLHKRLAELERIAALGVPANEAPTATVSGAIEPKRSGSIHSHEQIAVDDCDGTDRILEPRIGAQTAEPQQVIQELKRERAEQKRIETELREIIDHVPGLISYIDAHERTRFVNKADDVWFGIRRGDVIGMHSKDVVGTQAYESVSDHIAHALSGEEVQFELPLTNAKGEPGWGLVSVTPDIDEHQTIKGFFCYLTDISDQKRAEEALRESEERFRQLAENIREVFWLRSGNGRNLIYVSPAYEKIWKRSCASLYERPASLIEAIHPDDRQLVRETFSTSRDEGRVFDREYRILRPDGSIRWIRDRGFPVLDARGNVHRIAGIAEDITRWKSAEEQLRTNQKHLRSLASQVSLAEERERRRIAADLHDHVGQTLALAKIKLGGHRETLSAPDQLESIDEIRDLLEHTIRDTRSLCLELSPPVLYELGFDSAVDWLCERLNEQHGVVCHVLDDGRPKPLGDDIRVVLFQAVRELLFNVAKHAQVDRAEVKLDRVGEAIRVQIRDDGVGFEPSVGTAKDSEKHGYGLFSIGERISFLGGTFCIDAEPGKGTRVTITAPLKQPPSSDDETARE